MNETPSQTIGPFFRFGLDWMDRSNVVAPGSPGVLELRGVVYDGEGLGVPDGLIELWHTPHFERALTDADGSYRVTTVKPEVAPAGQAPHIDVSLFARGLLQRLVTRIYFPDEAAANASDPVLSRVPADRRATLVATACAGALRFDIHLQGPEETVFLAY